MKRLSKRAQSTLEYAVIIAVVAAGLVAMQIYLRRGVQGKLRESADKVGEQYSAGGTTATYKTKQTGSSKVKETFGLNEQGTVSQGVSYYKVDTPAEITRSATGTGKETVKPLADEDLFEEKEDTPITPQ